jgi:hypothetical protein
MSISPFLLYPYCIIERGLCQPPFLTFLVVAPLAADLALNDAASPFLLAGNGVTLAVEIAGEKLAIFKEYTVLHNDLSFSFVITLYHTLHPLSSLLGKVFLQVFLHFLFQFNALVR